MRAFVVTEPGKHSLSEVDDPVPGPGEVLVAPVGVGICGSDLEVLDGRRPAEYVTYPVVPGHEWSGRVVACGPGVHGVEPGTPVVAEGVRACGTCARCAEGRNNVCVGEYAETGFTHPGALAERVVVPAGQLHALPADRPVAPAALIEPAACVATGLLEVGMPPPGSRVAAVGDGALGLLAVSLLRLTQPSELLLFGSRPERTAYGRRLGATTTALRRELTPADEAELFGGYDLVVECTNSGAGAAAAVNLARRAGTVILLGISGAGQPSLDADTIVLNHLRIQGVFASTRQSWRWLVSLYAEGLFDPAPLITHRFGLDSVSEALSVLGDRSAQAVKVVVLPNDE